VNARNRAALVPIPLALDNWELHHGSVQRKLRDELTSFSSLWKGGYWNDVERDEPPRHLRRVAEYLQQFIHSSTTALEIGCGKGAWTKKMLQAKHIYCLDALSAKHNRFWRNVGKRHAHEITYVQVQNFLLEDIPNGSIDFVFSYDCFCHISYSGMHEYLRNLRPKLRDGARCLVMVGDYDKYSSCGETPALTPIYRTIEEELQDFDGPPYPGRWYWYGLERFCAALEQFGYQILDPDIDLDERDPICLFQNPGSAA
jgi:SAM-dependent methyltransferase